MPVPAGLTRVLQPLRPLAAGQQIEQRLSLPSGATAGADTPTKPRTAFTSKRCCCATSGAAHRMAAQAATSRLGRTRPPALWRLPELAPELSTTCVATMLTAGHAENALPQRAEAVLNCRVFPGVTVDSVQATLACIVADPAMKLEIMGHPEDSPVSEPRADLMAAIARAVHAAHPGVPIALYQEVGATGALVYRRAGIPTWGSAGFFMKRSDVFFHGRNERLPVAGFYEVVDHVHSLATELGSS